MRSTREVVLATRNRHKAAEIRRLLEGAGLVVRDLCDCPEAGEVVEDGATFEANASKKALACARSTGLVSLADDSGIEVDALSGRPGVVSARYAGEGATDAMNNAKLLAELEGVPPERRAARYVCVLAAASPGGRSECFRGTCEGRILDRGRGGGGFGYDPLFFSPELGCTFAEDAAAKSRVSHRSRAVRALSEALARGELDMLFAEGHDAPEAGAL
jgi:XTP/dITP diphosphohydrolase